MPKQRNPFLFGNNSARAQSAQRRQQRVQNLERAHVNVTNVTNTYELKRPRKPFNPAMPMSAPSGGTPITIHYVSYDGYLYSFSELGLTLITAPASAPDINSGRSLKTFDGNFYFIGDDFSDAGAFDSGSVLFRSVAGAASTRVSKPTISAVLVHFDIAVDGRIWAFWNDGTPSHVYYSDDQGDSWVLSETFANDGQVDLAQIVCHKTNADIVATTFLNILSEIELTSTINRGASWNSTVINGTAGFVGPIVPVYHVHFAGDNIVAIYPADSGPQQLFSTKADSGLGGLITNTAEGDVVQWWGSVVNQDDPDVIVAVAVNASAVTSFYLSTDRGLSYTLTTYPLSNRPFGMIFSNNILYLAIITGVNETSFYKIIDVRTSMTMELLFVSTDANVVPEAASDNFART